MKIIYDYIPANSSDSSITFTGSTELSGFPATNLKYIHPLKSWKTNNIVTDSTMKFDFGSNKTYNSLMINRFNFAAFSIDWSTNDVDYFEIENNIELAKDEIYDENYLHKWIDLTGLTYRYLRINIPTQTPLFETSYFKIGNVLVGNYTEIWNPKPGFQIAYSPKIYLKEYQNGYVAKRTIGRSKRIFTYSVDKISTTEYNLIRQTFSECVIYLDFENDETKTYIVRLSKEPTKTYELANIVSGTFEFEEIV